MKKLHQIMLIGLLLTSLLSLAVAEEPVIKTSGSVEVTGTAGNHGEPSFKTETHISVEIGFSDNLSAKVETSAQASNNHDSSLSLRQGYIKLDGNSSTASEPKVSLGKLPNLGMKKENTILTAEEKKLVKETAAAVIKPMAAEKPAAVLAQASQDK